MTETASFTDNGRERFRLVPLEWPLEFDGKTYVAISVKRLTAGEVVAFHQKLRQQPDDTPFNWPIYFAADGSDLPEGLLDAIDADDREVLDNVSIDFLPRKFLGVGNGGSGLAPGVSTA